LHRISTNKRFGKNKITIFLTFFTRRNVKNAFVLRLIYEVMLKRAKKYPNGTNILQSMNKNFYALAFLLLVALGLNAQKPGLTVTRCINAMDRSKTIFNIALDGENNKWVANEDGFTQVQACDLATPVILKLGERSVLNYPSGNIDQRWQEDAIRPLIKNSRTITSAYYDKEKDWLWIGTDEYGLFQLATQPQLRLITQHEFKGASKSITSIFRDKTGKYWIGTEDGIYFGTPGRWRNKLGGLQIQRVRETATDILVLADAELWKTRNGDSWDEIAVPEKAYEGSIYDVDVDFDGHFWLASAIVARYNPATEEVVAFGPADDYTSEYATRITVDADNAIWVGTRDKGLFVIQKTGAFAVTCVIEKQLSCNGNGKDAELRVKTSGAKGKLRYDWSFVGLGGEHPVNMKAGTYTVTVTDEAGRTKTAKITIPDPKLNVMVRQRQSETAPGAADAIAEVAVTGGTPGYTFRWDNGETTNPARRLSEGARSVTVSDQTGCISIAMLAVTQQVSALNVKINETVPIRCNGGTTALKTTVTGGRGNYNYQWSAPALTGQNPENVAAGTYTVTVSDEVGNVITNRIVVIEPAALSAVASVQTPASNARADGKATVQATGGNGKYTYKWDNNETNANAARLSAGKHNVTVTDGNGCTATTVVEMSEGNAALSVALKEMAPIKCSGNKTTVVATINGGKGPFTKEWSDGSLKGEQPDNVTAGTYQLTITDATGTKSTATITLKEPTALTIKAEVTTPATTNKSDGKATVTAKGGVGPYTYKWDSGETTANASQLAPGARSVSVTDANGCTAVSGINVSENVLELAVEIVEKMPIKCSGQKGTIAVEAKGGKSPFEYKWSDPSFKSGEVSGVGRGTYSVTVTDQIGTTATASIAVSDPTAMQAIPTPLKAAALGQTDGQATVRTKGGTAPYAYKWDNNETTEKAMQLSAGKHSITVIDANGCTSSNEVDIAENVPPVSAKIELVEPVKCFNGTGALRAIAQGGKPPYKYLWSESPSREALATGLLAGEYKVNIIDVAGNQETVKFSLKQPDKLVLNPEMTTPASTGKSDGKANAGVKGGTAPYAYKWDNGESAAEAQKLKPGKHNFTVTDANGCIATAIIEVTENILPLKIKLEETGKIRCPDQKSALKAIASGGKGTYTYTWGNPALKGETPADLEAGTYQITVTDEAGGRASTAIIIEAPQPLTMTISNAVAATVADNDGKATAQVKGGTSPYKYVWNNGETTATATKLPAGRATLTITDANGCTIDGSVTVDANIPPMTLNIAETQPIRCEGQPGALQANIKGGKPPYAYKWNNATLRDDAPTNVLAGTYQLTVTDQRGVTQTATITINAPTAIRAEISRNIGTLNERSSDGRAAVVAKGGTGKLTITWDNGETGPNASKLTMGAHKVSITDVNNCTAVLDLEVRKRILPALDRSTMSVGQAIPLEQLTFKADSTNLESGSLPVIDELYSFLLENENITVEIGGHTNNVPSDEYCDRLSTARAKSVAEYLTRRGIDASRVTFKGYGKRKPIAPNTTPEGRKKNQRVEVKIVAIK
jgi:outer membrane protein OmpA-like peptidoglycan-associated protein